MKKTRQKILDAAYEVLARDLSAPLDKVAEAAEISRMTLHRHFTTRQDLIEGMWWQFIETGSDIIERALSAHEQPKEQLKAIVMEASMMGDQYHFLMHVGEELDETSLNAAVEMESKMLAILTQLQQADQIKEHINSAWIMHLYNGVLTAAWGALSDGSVAPRDIPQLTWDAFETAVFN